MKMKLLIVALMAISLVSSLSSAFVFRNVSQERADELARYNQYKQDYVQLNDLKGYEQYIYEPNLKRSFGFYPASRYAAPAAVYNAKYNPPLQGEIYSTENRQYASSLDQPNAVKYYGEKVNGRYTGYVQPDLNGVYFDHPDAKKTYGTISYSYNLNSYNSYPGAVGYGYDGVSGEPDNWAEARYYARVADQVTDDYYVVGYI
jgi:hypothetical protein